MKFKTPLWLKKWLRYRSFKKAVKSANKLSRMYHKKYLVILWKNEFKAVPKSLLKSMWHQGQFKSKSWSEVEKMAVYTSPPLLA